VTANGRFLVGRPAVVTPVAGKVIALMDPTGIFVNDEGAEIDYSRYAAVVLDSAATGATQLRDLWARNEVGIRIDRWCD